MSTSTLPASGDELLATKLRRPIERVIHLENASGVALVVSALVAIALANSPLRAAVEHFWHNHLSVSFGPFHLDESLVHWVNDGLMTLFFLVAGFEIKRELVAGELRDPRRAALPALAAVGGMVVPAAVFFALTAGSPGSSGWGIPMATDIAFAVGVLSLLGDRVPSSLKVFLLTLAIVDDLGAIVVIAVFYSSSISFAHLGAAVAGLVVMGLCRRAGFWWTPAYVLMGVAIWYLTFESGVHATLAGVAIGLLAPARPHRPRPTAVHIHPETTLDEVKGILFDARETRSVCDRMIHILHPWTAFIVLPVFALANAGVYLGGGAVSSSLTSTLTAGVVLGLVVGKPVGIVAASWLAVRSGLATLPRGVTWQHLMGTGVLAGIGFTVSIFISGLAYGDELLVAQAKIGILVASFAAAGGGAWLIKRAAATTPASAVEVSTAPAPTLPVLVSAGD